MSRDQRQLATVVAFAVIGIILAVVFSWPLGLIAIGAIVVLIQYALQNRSGGARVRRPSRRDR